MNTIPLPTMPTQSIDDNIETLNEKYKGFEDFYKVDETTIGCRHGDCCIRLTKTGWRFSKNEATYPTPIQAFENRKKDMNIAEEKTAVESRLAEIENEMSTDHRDHAFEYWWEKIPERVGMSWKESHHAAFSRAHMIYSHAPKIIIERPLAMGWYTMFAIGVVCGLAISLLTFAFTIN